MTIIYLSEIEKSDNPASGQKTQGHRKNVKQIVINKIQEELKSGRIPWQSPYLKGQDGETKCNFVSGHSYKGTNEILLAFNPDTYYMTFKQAEEFGAKVKKGASSEMVIFWKMYNVKDEETGEEKIIPLLNYYRVFGISQVDFTGVEDKFNSMFAKRKSAITDNHFNTDIEDFIYLSKADIRHEKKDEAFYSPKGDYISVPQINTFKNSDTYYQVLFHELTHWTGHSSRLDRIAKGKQGFVEKYSKEELVAELGACFLTAEFGLTPDYRNSAAYIQGWSQFISENQNALFSASTEASKAVDFLKRNTIEG